MGSEEENGCRAQGRTGGEKKEREGVRGCHTLGAETRLRLWARWRKAPSCPPPDVPAGPLLTP